METQGKLLRVLETKLVRKVGDTAEQEVEHPPRRRHQPRPGRVGPGRQFREDLYYRLNVVPIFLPPLRERQGDIPLLAMCFPGTLLQEDWRSQVKGFTPEAMAQMESYAWPGNVRELRNIVERMAILCDCDRIEPRASAGRNPPGPPAAAVTQLPHTWDEFKRLKQQVREAAVRDLERRFLTEALQRCGGNVSKAAEEVGIQRTNFHALMRKHGPQRRDWSKWADERLGMPPSSQRDTRL